MRDMKDSSLLGVGEIQTLLETQTSRMRLLMKTNNALHMRIAVGSSPVRDQLPDTDRHTDRHTDMHTDLEQDYVSSQVSQGSCEYPGRQVSQDMYLSQTEAEADGGSGSMAPEHAASYAESVIGSVVEDSKCVAM
ncbi:hypothetical protein KIPB_007549 [Kipferlia bialata]|uniref:Uncharacterized protein n=1 Tax=Kipferlia bialata TaxID=797122 RepID=A0A391NX55_9EUKA|nr:hypothetical protein KIPB_007549 [Kipferlia bialata]|eukprot:g7549.t1